MLVRGRHWVVSLVALMLAALLSVPSAAADETAIKIEASEAFQHIGEFAEVCGHVASAAYLGTIGGRPTFLNFERPYPDQVFTVVIWGSSRENFDGRPESLYDGKTLCVTGKVAVHEGVAQIIVDHPDQIVVTSEVAVNELTDFERVYVKAVLAALGHDVNYGLGEWDEEAVEAMIAFQENAGVAPSGEADPATLRALADAAVGMSESECDLIIRLLLFELARRQE